MILMQKLSYYTSARVIGLPQTVGKEAGRKQKLEKEIVLPWIDPIRVIKEGRGLCVSGQKS